MPPTHPQETKKLIIENIIPNHVRCRRYICCLLFATEPVLGPQKIPDQVLEIERLNVNTTRTRSEGGSRRVSTIRSRAQTRRQESCLGKNLLGPRQTAKTPSSALPWPPMTNQSREKERMSVADSTAVVTWQYFMHGTHTGLMLTNPNQSAMYTYFFFFSPCTSSTVRR